MFIVIEGIDGCGKTTQANRLLAWLESKLEPCGVLPTREPGGWAGGEGIRELILGGKLTTVWSEFFAFMTDRCEHVARVIAPALAEGKCVLCDRYIQSTLAYQVLSNPDIPPGTAEYMTSLSGAIGLPDPDCVCFLDIDPDTAKRRLAARSKSDSFDGKGADFFARVRGAYYRMMEMSPGTWIKIDASRSEDAVFRDLTGQLEDFLPPRAKRAGV